MLARSETAEQRRLDEPPAGHYPQWQLWGPYVAERSWGTVREDYSWNGDAWGYFGHSETNERVFRWGEDGIAGWCDRYQILIFAPAFWNTKDPILKERLFGLSAHEGNHGEDVKEYYFYLDGTPTHSYMKYLYKYPQEEFPYARLVEENKNRSSLDPEFELIDTGVFDQNRYFDIVIEYAKEGPEETFIRIEAFNRSDRDAPLHLLGQLWYRNQWRWDNQSHPRPVISASDGCLIADPAKMPPPPNLLYEYQIGKRYLYGPKDAQLLFTDNEPSGSPYAKDAFNEKIVGGKKTTNPKNTGTKACFYNSFPVVKANGSIVVRFRLTNKQVQDSDPLDAVDKVIAKRKEEADAFYKTIHPSSASEDEKRIQRQALAGILWNKQFYYFDVELWLNGDNPDAPPPASRLNLRNIHWRHLNSMRVLLMPDKWEYPWFAAWDLAFHCITLGLIDIKFAKEQIWLLLFEQFQHPNGQIPAYEWDFSDLNPPVQAWGILWLYRREKELTGKGDSQFLKLCYQKLLINFSWWINRVDSYGNNVFEGGFLGLDNICVVDRSEKLSDGAVLQQSDGTGWMAFYALGMMRIALEIAYHDPAYELAAVKFFQHFAYIAHAMKIRGNLNYELWSNRDGFFYDVVTYPSGEFIKFRVRSLVGVVPLFPADIITPEELDAFPTFAINFHWFLRNRASIVKECMTPIQEGTKTKYLLSLVDKEQLARILQYIWNPTEFRSDYGLRSLSKYHQENPYIFNELKVGYEPAESMTRIKGGNSNWRGPIWLPTTYLFLQALNTFSQAYGSQLKIACDGEGMVDMQTMLNGFVERILSIFKENEEGVRPFRRDFPLAKDPYWKDHLLFYEYFHGDTGKGLGASHQTGWTALIANLIDEFRGKHGRP